MKIDSLEKLYQDQMASLRRGEEHFLDFLPKLVGVTTHAELRDWVRELIPHIREQIGRIEQVLPDNPITRQGEGSPGIAGLIDEGHLFLERASDPDVIDAGLVILFQRILHDSMARYRALRTFAVLLGHEEEAASFQRCVDDQAEAEETLAKLAMDAIHGDALSASSR